MKINVLKPILYSILFLLSYLPVSTAASNILISNVITGPAFIVYNQNTTVNMLISGGAGPYTANLIWCKQGGLGGQCTLPNGILGNTVVSAIPTSGNYLTFSVNVLAYNSIGITFNSVTYTLSSTLSTSDNATTIFSNSIEVANSVYGIWQFNGIIQDSGTNSIAIAPQPNNIPFLAIGPALPQLQFSAPGGFLLFATNFGNNTLSVINVVPSNVPASSVTNTISTDSGPYSLISPPTRVSSIVPAMVGTVNYNAGTVTLINTATKKTLSRKVLGATTQPIAMAFAPNSISFSAAIANFGTNTIAFVNPMTGNVFNIAYNGIQPSAMTTFFSNTGAQYLYVSNYGSNSVIPINLQTMIAGNSIDLGAGARPRGITASPFGYIYVADYGTNTISVINGSSTSPSVIANVVISGPNPLNGPYSIAMNPTSPRLYVTNYNSNTISVLDPWSYKLLSTAVVNSLSVSNPISTTASPDGTLLYVSNYGSNNIAVLTTNTFAIKGYLPANQPTSVALMQNFFYNGSNPGNVIFTVFTPSNQLSAKLLAGGGSATITTNTIQYALSSTSANFINFTFSTAGNGNYLPTLISKSFGVLKSYPTIQMKITLANGTSFNLNSENQNITISGFQNKLFPVTLSANIVSNGNQLPSNMFLNGAPISTNFNSIFSTTYNSLPLGNQNFIFNSTGNGNYLPVDPGITLTVLAPPSSPISGGVSLVVVTVADNLSSMINSTTPVFKVYLKNPLGNLTLFQFYQSQLPWSVSFYNNGPVLNVSLSCSLVIGKNTYNFTGNIYGIGLNSQCGKNYTVYGGTVTGIYSRITTQSTPVAPLPTPTSRQIIISGINGIAVVNSSATNPGYVNFTSTNSLITVFTNSTNQISLSLALKNILNGTPIAPPNYSKITTLSLSLNRSVGNLLNLQMRYPCGIQSSRIAPFILKNNMTWRMVSQFNTNATSCTTSFTVPSDPIISLMQRYSSAIINSSIAPAKSVTNTVTSSGITPIQNSTANAPKPLQNQSLIKSQGQSNNNTPIIISAIIIVGAIILGVYLKLKRAKHRSSR